ncbi:hypothetical protein ACFW9O_17790 [Streptomyces sp. NPDC059499]|uniref:hypothetical protein n=1 Tax=Streptomyces sp. NPDC059499 TaxID=3346852 RepID=UPI0036794C9B
MRTTFVRSTGGHVAEREIPAEGSKREQELSKLADDEGSEWRRETDPLADPVDDEPKRPPKSGSKADWLAYAVSQGASEEDAAAATRDELAALYAEPETPKEVTPDAADS